ncbi:hypothetical protein BpHYR1_019053 [Brachionus plicatilis]|uniref:Uncharacterized protein n=1 Tax=Brachionus plicatilis TaxID=10195 RepID=A0A3M7P4H0_BRAPC|nr:hypothetical protein BpHYR1_019053 [Brachionus plicatilis]
MFSGQISSICLVMAQIYSKINIFSSEKTIKLKDNVTLPYLSKSYKYREHFLKEFLNFLGHIFRKT